MVNQKALKLIQDSFCCYRDSSSWHMCNCYELDFIYRFILHIKYNNFSMLDTKRCSKIIGLPYIYFTHKI